MSKKTIFQTNYLSGKKWGWENGRKRWSLPLFTCQETNATNGRVSFTKVFTDGGIQLFHPIRSAFFIGLKSAHVYTLKSVYIPCHSNLYYKVLKFLESSSCYIIKLWKGEVGIASCPFLKITNKDFTQVMGNTLT